MAYECCLSDSLRSSIGVALLTWVLGRKKRERLCQSSLRLLYTVFCMFLMHNLCCCSKISAHCLPPWASPTRCLGVEWWLVSYIGLQASFWIWQHADASNFVSDFELVWLTSAAFQIACEAPLVSHYLHGCWAEKSVSACASHLSGCFTRCFA